MKMDCDVIKDLLPLYAEEMTSQKSEALIKEHFEECDDCKKVYDDMKKPEPQITFKSEPSENFKKYVKKAKRSSLLKIVLIVLTGLLVQGIVFWGLMGVLIWDSASAKIDEYTNVAEYEQLMGENAKEEFRNKWGMDETIFPKEITEEMNVKEYKMVYYNPWDAQYLSYLTVEYSDADYRKELERLKKYDSTEYKGIYSVTGFAEEENPLAMYADEYQGFVYAITTPKQENTITYVELIFCNYFYDLDYKKYIPKEYLPEGFDATMDNPYEKKLRAQ